MFSTPPGSASGQGEAAPEISKHRRGGFPDDAKMRRQQSEAAAEHDRQQDLQDGLDHDPDSSHGPIAQRGRLVAAVQPGFR
jgi:hypothetical protein